MNASNAALRYEPREENSGQMMPLADRLFIRVNEQRDEVSDGGIILPKTRRDVVSDGVVIAVGPEVEVLQVGDQVLKVDVLGVDCGSRPGVVQRHPELAGVFVIREHEVTAATGPGLEERARSAKERGACIATREPSRTGRW